MAIDRYRSRPRKSEATIRSELDSLLRAAVQTVEIEPVRLRAIGPNVSFRDWCEEMAKPRLDPVTGEMRPGLLVDGKPFRLDDRRAMAWIYDQIPSTHADAQGWTIVLRKCAQVGFTVLEMLVVIYFALKFEPLHVGMFTPAVGLSRTKSAMRFAPMIASIPPAYERLTQGEHVRRSSREGNVSVRQLGQSLIHSLHTSGKVSTESFPMDFVSFDEVQEMTISQMEKVRERLSASTLKLTLMGSTAKWPDADIDYWYKTGSQHRFHTRCPTCGVEEPLDDYFPDCIKFDPAHPDRISKTPGDFRYVCRSGHWIDDPQQGEWKPDNPEAYARRILSIHFHQMLSPTISPREMYEAYVNADDMQNFFNRKLGKPYQDASQIPVTLAHLNACAEAGMAAGVVWKKRAGDTFMGIDQMGAYNVVIIKERLSDGRQAVIHVEEIYSNDPFVRCSELMGEYGVRVCVVEKLPNFNDALRFANRHLGRVFLCSYGDLGDDVMRWGDRPKLDASERRTDEDERTRYTVRIDQYKAMSLSLARLVDTKCLFPDPQALTQEIRKKDARELKPILKDVVFLHFQKTALVTERIHEDERKLRRRVVKVGIDPHFSFANMLCDVAWARAHTKATFIFPDTTAGSARSSVAAEVAGLPAQIAALMEQHPSGHVCARCEHYPMGVDGPPAQAHCSVYGAIVRGRDPGCDYFDLNERLPGGD